jgi:hypothetical protein
MYPDYSDFTGGELHAASHSWLFSLLILLPHFMQQSIKCLLIMCIVGALGVRLNCCHGSSCCCCC